MIAATSGQLLRLFSFFLSFLFLFVLKICTDTYKIIDKNIPLFYQYALERVGANHTRGSGFPGTEDGLEKRW